MKMKRATLVILPLIFSAATAFAQSPQSSIRESTDPARIAEIQRRAEVLRSGQGPMGSDGQAPMHMRGPMMQGHDHMQGRSHGDGMGPQGMRQDRMKHGQMRQGGMHDGPMNPGGMRQKGMRHDGMEPRGDRRMRHHGPAAAPESAG